MKRLISWFAAMCMLIALVPSATMSAYAANGDMSDVVILGGGVSGTLEGWTVSGDGEVSLVSEIVDGSAKAVAKIARTAGEDVSFSYDLGKLSAGTYKLSVTAKLPGDHGTSYYGITSDSVGTFPENSIEQGVLTGNSDEYVETSRMITVTDATVNQTVTIAFSGGTATEAYITDVALQLRLSEETIGPELLAVPNINDVSTAVGNVNTTMLKVNNGLGWWWTTTNGRNTMLANVSVNGVTRKVIRFYPISNKTWGDAIIQGDVNTTGSVLEAGTYECKILGKTVGSPGKVYWGMRYDVDGGMDSVTSGQRNVFAGSDGDFAWMTARFTVKNESNGIAVFSDNTGSKSGQILVAEASVKKVIPEEYDENLIENNNFAYGYTAVDYDGGSLDGWTVENGTIDTALDTVDEVAKPVLKWTRTAGANTTLKYSLGKLEAKSYKLTVKAKLLGDYETAYFGVTSDSNGSFPENAVNMTQIPDKQNSYVEISREITVTDANAEQYFTIELDGGDSTVCFITEVSIVDAGEELYGPELLAVPNIDDVPSSYLGDVNDSMLKTNNGNGWGWTSINGQNTQLINTTVRGKTRQAIQFFPISNEEWGYAVVQGDFDSTDSYLEAGTYECKILGKTEGDPGNVYWGLRSDTEGGMSTAASGSDHVFLGSGGDFGWMTARFTATGGENGLSIYSDNTGSTDGQILVAEASVRKVNEDYVGNLIENGDFWGDDTVSDAYWIVQGSSGYSASLMDVNGEIQKALDVTYLSSGTTVSALVGGLEAGTYELSADISSSGNVGTGSFGIYYDSNGSFPSNSTGQIPSNSDWTTITRTITVKEKIHGQAVAFYVGGGDKIGHLYISNVSLRKKNDDGTYGENKVLNPDFSIEAAEYTDNYISVPDSAYGKLECDIYYNEANREEVKVSFNSDGTNVHILTLAAHEKLILGAAELEFADGSGWYHLEALVDHSRLAPIYTLTTPIGRVVQRSDNTYFGGTSSISGFDIKYFGSEIKNVTVNTADETDLPTYLGHGDVKVYNSGLIADKKSVPVSANSIRIDFNSFSHDKAALDAAVSVVKASDGTVVPITTTTYTGGIYTASLGEKLEPDTKYNVVVSGELTAADGEKLGEAFVSPFVTQKSFAINVTGITSGSSSVTEIAQLTEGNTATVGVKYSNLTGEDKSYSVLAGYYDSAEKLIGAQVIGSKSVEATVTSASHTYSFTIGSLNGVSEIRFYIWNSVDGLRPLADEYILSKDLFTDSQVYNLITGFNGDAGTSRGFAWTSVADHTNMVIQYARADELWSASKQTVAATYESYEGELFHKAQITGMEPGKTYIYRIGDSVDDIWSEFYEITTEPETVDEFSFVAVSDPQSGNWNGYASQQSVIANGMAFAPDAAFIMNMGDLTDDGDSVEQWNWHFDSLDGYRETIPYVPVMGNHESAYIAGSKYFSLRFNHSDDIVPYFDGFSTSSLAGTDAVAVTNNIQETVYSFEYGDAFFAVLNCSAWGYDDAMKILEPQKEWLRDELEKTDKKWKFVMLHQGLYPAKTERWNSRLGLEELLNEFDVDVVLAGHDHIVTRTYPMKDGQIMDYSAVREITKGTGTVYNIVGSSGLKRYEAIIDTPEYAAVLNATPAQQASYTVVKVSEDSIKVVTKQINGAVIDEYEIIDAA